MGLLTSHSILRRERVPGFRVPGLEQPRRDTEWDIEPNNRKKFPASRLD